MKKVIVILVIIVLVVGGFFCFKSLNKTNEDNNVVENKVEESTLSSELVEEVVDINNASIVGKWENNTTIPDYSFTYTFKEDGTGTYVYGDNVMNFKYTIDGENISFEYTDEDMESLDTTFEVNGNSLNVRDSLGEDVIYLKVEE